MWEAFTNMASNLGFPFEVIIMIVFFIGGLIFYAKDFKVGVVMHWVTWAALFIWFYQQNWNWALPLIMFMIWLVLLAFVLYPTSKAAEQGAFI